MNYLILTRLHLKKNKRLILLAIFQITVAVIVVNITLSSVIQSFGKVLFADGFNDESLYCVAPCHDIATREIGIPLSGEEAMEMLTIAHMEYAREMGIDINENEAKQLPFIDTYDFIVRWMGQNRSSDEYIAAQYKVYNEVKEICEASAIVSDVATKNLVQVEPINTGHFQVIDITIIDKLLANNTSSNVKSGKALSETKADINQIEAVISGRNEITSKIDIGDTFELRLFNFKKNCYETKEIRIAGIIPSPFYSYWSGNLSNNNEETLDTLIMRAAFDTNNDYISVFVLPFEGFDVIDYRAISTERYYFRINNNATAEEIKALNDEFLINGYNVVALSTLYQNSFDESMDTVRDNAVIFIISIIMCIVTTAGVLLLTIYKNMKKHIVYSFCGASPKDNIIVNVLYVLLILTASSVLSIIYILIWNYLKTIKTHELFGITFGSANVLLTLAFYLLILLFSMIIPIKKFLNVKLSEQWRDL